MYWKPWMAVFGCGLLLAAGGALAELKGSDTAQPPPQASSSGRVLVVEISGAINPVSAAYTSKHIQAANDAGDALVVLQMDTPGGLDTSMRQIIKAIQASNVPVATYVAPSGSRAASAGTFITIASHIAAMTPGTNIGAAHPVNMMGGQPQDKEGKPSPMEEKVVNDASAYIRSLAEKRGRNAYWAEKAVRQSQSISAEEAKKLGVIDLVAGSLDALLLAIDGREVKLDDGRTVTLDTKNKEVVHLKMTPREEILDVISNPNVAYILMMIGMVGLYFELSNPGLILPGILGGISMILALYAMQTLPINYAGLLLILLAGILFVVELNVPTFGLLSAGGTVSLLLGSIMLIDSDDPAMQISNTVLIPTLAVSIAVTVGALWLATRSAGLKAVSGHEGLVGEHGTAYSKLNPQGKVRVHGEIWQAVCDGSIDKGDAVVVEGLDGLTVKVRKSG
ncbi:NfeD family protein [Nitrospina watsonii]|uniref:Membrane-bound ClpP-class protease associated with aq_911 n=1 Tax=Nitrospina watsonii TaxID=1323948 RepID=A0ABM9HCE1_9BACT|nr:nodulation protein NfeD [Nitrospina watsonii]CAI2717762.1 Putative membrane-bound ClpP-class protease associated with aq_911 [Nitrospina watsonii]